MIRAFTDGWGVYKSVTKHAPAALGSGADDAAFDGCGDGAGAGVDG
jgi:hypothetical protein